MVLFSSICFIQVLRVTKCLTDCDWGIPPICMLGVASTICGFIFSVTRASNNFALQHFMCIKRILFKDRALPFFFHICVREVWPYALGTSSFSINLFIKVTSPRVLGKLRWATKLFDLNSTINKIDRGRTISDGPHIQNRNINNRKYKTHFGLRGFLTWNCWRRPRSP